MLGSLFNPRPVYRPDVISIQDALDLPNFNAMYQANPESAQNTSKYCDNEILREAFERAVVNEMINCSGSQKVDLNFFENAFGWTERDVEAKEVWNMYDTDEDYNIFFEAAATATGAGLVFTVTLARANHSGNGKYSWPAKGMSIVDKENNIWYSIEDKNDDNDFGHVLTLQPFVGSVVGSVSKYKKYLVFPARFVGGYSCPLPMNAMPTVGYMQKVNPFRLRRDWWVKIDLLRGYTKILRWAILWDQNGKEIDAWDTYQAQKAREDLQLARNILAFLATPIDNADLINGTGVTMVDDVHTGFYGYLPSIKYGGGNVLDYDPSIGYDLGVDLEPFILQQDALKQSMSYSVRHGKSFKASLIDNANKMVYREKLGVDMFPAFQRNGGTLKKLEIDGYEWLGFKLAFSEWGALNDSRLLGGQYFDNMAIFSPLDGVTDRTGAAIPSIEFYQYGGPGRRHTGDYYENMVDFRDTTLCEELKGSVMQSVMMAVHCPHKHILLNPILGC